MRRWVEKRWDETYQLKEDENGQSVLVITKLYGTRKAVLIRTSRTEQA